MKNKIFSFVVFVVVFTSCGVYGQTGFRVRNDDTLRTVVLGYSRNSMADEVLVSRFKALSDQGDPRATLWLARLYQGGRCGLAEEPGVADSLAVPVMDQIFKLAEGGDHEAQFLVGSCYHEGFVLDLDLVEAGKWYKKAIQGEQLAAYENLAILLAEGAAGESDIGQARELLRAGSRLGSPTCGRRLNDYAPPDSQSLARFRALHQNKVVAALGRTTERAVHVLTDSGVITDPGASVDFSEGALTCLDFEDDGIVLKADGDGVVRSIDAYRGMTTSDEARGGIPFGIAWSDNGNKIKAKLGKPYQEYGLTGKGARQYVYQAGNMMFSLVDDTLNKDGIKFWRVREMWHEDFPDAK